MDSQISRRMFDMGEEWDIANYVLLYDFPTWWMRGAIGEQEYDKKVSRQNFLCDSRNRDAIFAANLSTMLLCEDFVSRFHIFTGGDLWC